jgi:hypothetical protein
VLLVQLNHLFTFFNYGEEISQKQMEEIGEFGLFILLHNTKPSNLVELKICMGGEFSKVYINSSNLIHVILMA